MDFDEQPSLPAAASWILTFVKLCYILIAARIYQFINLFRVKFVEKSYLIFQIVTFKNIKHSLKTLANLQRLV